MVAQAAAAAPLLLPIAREVGQRALELANVPVLGAERIERYTTGRRNPKEVVSRFSFTVRAWELALLGGLGLAAFLAGVRVPGILPPPPDTPRGRCYAVCDRLPWPASAACRFLCDRTTP